MMDYNFRVTGTLRKCLDRQIDGGLRITESETAGGKILNSKNEWFTKKFRQWCGPAQPNFPFLNP